MNLNSPLEKVVVNIELEQRVKSPNLLICFDNDCNSPYSDYFGNVYSNKSFQQFMDELIDDSEQNNTETRKKNIKIIYPADSKNISINKIFINSGNKN